MEQNDDTFRRIFMALPDPAFVLRLEDNRILHINEALKSYGFYQDDQVIGTKEIAGRTWVNLKQRELFYRRLQEKGTITDFEVQFRLSSGEIHLMLLSARLMELGGDQVAIVQAKDVDHIKKEEKEHESYQSHLEELLKEKEAQLKRQVDIPQKKQLAKIPLTRMEKMALYGLVAYPDLTMSQLADKLRMNRVSLNCIRNRLLKEGYFYPACLPRYDLLGFPYIHMSYARQKMDISKEDPIAWKEITGFLDKCTNLIFCLVISGARFSLTMYHDFREYQETRSSVQAMNHDHRKNFMPEHEMLHVFDQRSKMNFFSFAGIVDRFFSLGQEPVPRMVKTELVEVTEREKRLVQLAVTGCRQKSELAKKLGISMPTLKRTMYDVNRKGLCVKTNVPVFAKLGAEMMVLAHWKNMSPPEVPNTFFSIQAGSEHWSIGLYRDYTELNADHRLQDQSASVIIFPMQNLIYRKQDFVSLAKFLK